MLKRFLSILPVAIAGASLAVAEAGTVLKGADIVDVEAGKVVRRLR